MKNKIIGLLLSVALVLVVALALPKTEVKAADYDYSVVNPDNASKTYPTNIPDAWYDYENKCGAYLDEDGTISGVSPTNSMTFVDLIDSNGYINYANNPLIQLNYLETVTFYIEAGFMNWGQGIPYVSCSLSCLSEEIDIEVSQKYGDTEDTGLFVDGKFDSQTFASSNYDRIEPIHRDIDTDEVTPNTNYHLICVSVTAKEETCVNGIMINIGDGKSGGCSTSIELVVHVEEDKSLINYDEFNFGSEKTSNGVYYSANLNSGNIAFPISDGEMLNFISNQIMYDSIDIGGSYFTESVIATVSFSGEDNRYIIANSQILFKETGEYLIKATRTISFSFPFYNGSQYEKKTITQTQNFDINFFIYDASSFTFQNNREEMANVSYYLTDAPLFIEVANDSDDISSRILVDGEFCSNDELVAYFEGSLPIGQHSISASIKNKYTGTTIRTKDIFVNIDTSEAIYPNIVFAKGNSATFANDQIDSDRFILVTEIIKYEQISTSGTITIETDVADSHADVEGGYLYLYNVRLGITNIYVEARYSGGIKRAATFTVNVIPTFSNYTVSQLDIELNLLDKTKTNIEFGTTEDDVFSKISSNEYFFSYNIPNNLVEMKQSELDRGVINVSTTGVVGSAICNILVYHNEELITIINISVLVTNDTGKVTETTFNFVEGTKANMVLSNTEGLVLNIDPFVATLKLKFMWYSLNTKVATVAKIDQTSAKVSAVGSGNTQIVAIYSDSNGSTVSGTINIVVLESTPTIGITVTKEDDSSAFTIYDELSISLNRNNFNFSSSTIYTWYLDDERISLGLDAEGNPKAIENTTTAFCLKMSEGLHKLRVVLNDSANGINIEGIQEVNITSVINQERIIGVDCDDTIYMGLDGGRFKVSALIDGVVNNDYEYSFSIDNVSIVSIFMNDANSTLIEAKKCGETVLNVFTNIGKYETKIIRKEIKIIVEEVEKIELITETEFYKPGSTAVFELVVNGKQGFVNIDPNIVITINGQNYEYAKEGNKITVEAMPAGKLELSASYKGINRIDKYDVTDFNFKQFILIVLPYLCGAAVLAILIYAIIKINGNPYANVEKALKKTNDKFASEKEKIAKKPNAKTVRKSYAKLERKVNSLLNKIIYYYDEGIDEYKNAISKVESLKKVMLALIKTSKTDINVDKAVAILDNLINNQMVNITDVIKEIIASHKRYTEAVKKTMSKEDMKSIKENKKRMTKEEYEHYLIEKGVISDERSNDGE